MQQPEYPPHLRLQPNFTLGEMSRTNHRSHALRNLIAAADYIDALRATAAMLQVIRDHFGQPVIVNSGFRCAALNRAVGGSRRSQHLRGEAADIRVVGVPLVDVFDWVRQSDIPFGQLILEGITTEPTWIHISLGPPWRSAATSRQAMTWSRSAGYQRAT